MKKLYDNRYFHCTKSCRCFLEDMESAGDVVLSLSSMSDAHMSEWERYISCIPFLYCLCIYKKHIAFIYLNKLRIHCLLREK